MWFISKIQIFTIKSENGCFSKEDWIKILKYSRFLGLEVMILHLEVDSINFVWKILSRNSNYSMHWGGLIIQKFYVVF